MMPYGLESMVTKLLANVLPRYLNFIYLTIIICNLVSIKLLVLSLCILCQEVDMAMGLFFQTYFRYQAVDFSEPLMFESIGIFLPRPRRHANLANFLQPFTAWVRLPAAFLLVGEASCSFSPHG